jgi:hypothetical protein
VEEEDAANAANAHFTAVLRACNHLTGEIAFVQNQMSPCFPLYWALEMLWSTCVAHVCSKQILDQIGGTEGHKLPDLTVTQLLDLVAWVENFRETIEESLENTRPNKHTLTNGQSCSAKTANKSIWMSPRIHWPGPTTCCGQSMIWPRMNSCSVPRNKPMNGWTMSTCEFLDMLLLSLSLLLLLCVRYNMASKR